MYQKEHACFLCTGEPTTRNGCRKRSDQKLGVVKNARLESRAFETWKVEEKRIMGKLESASFLKGFGAGACWGCNGTRANEDLTKRIYRQYETLNSWNLVVFFSVRWVSTCRVSTTAHTHMCRYRYARMPYPALRSNSSNDARRCPPPYPMQSNGIALQLASSRSHCSLACAHKHKIDMRGPSDQILSVCLCWFTLAASKSSVP